MQIESLKTKCSKAAEIAVKLAGEKTDKVEKIEAVKQVAKDEPVKSTKELEKKITKLRNENQTLAQQVDRATRLLEREIGECVDIDSLYKEDSGWKGRAQKIEVLKAQLKTAKVNGSETMSVISEYQPSTISKAEKNLNQM